MTYTKKLSNPKWQKKRLEILQRDKFTCQLCYDTETELHIHHKKYSGEPWEVDNEHLITLCAHCHALEESKTYNKILSVFKRKKSHETYRITLIADYKNLGATLSIYDIDGSGITFICGFTKKALDDYSKILSDAQKLI